MRGCLFTLLLGVAVLVVGAWLLLPPLAAGVITAGLSAAGVQGSGTTVVVDASPPLELVVGRADSVHIGSTDVTWGDLRIGRLDLEARGVDLFARTTATLEGTLTSVRLVVAGGLDVDVASITIAGSSSAPTATLRIDAATVSRVATGAIETATGSRPERVALAAPDRVSVTVGGVTAAGRLLVDESGEVVVSIAGQPPVVVVPSGPGNPFRFTRATVGTGGGIVLDAILAPGALGLAG